MVVLDYAGEVAVFQLGVVHHRGSLVVGFPGLGLGVLLVKDDAAVLKSCPTCVSEVVVNRSSEEKLLMLGQCVTHLEVVHAQPDHDVGVFEHVVNELSVSLCWQVLVSVLWEVPVVPVVADRDSVEHLGRQLGRGLVPLLPRVLLEDLVVQHTANAGQCGLFTIDRRTPSGFDLIFCKPLLHLRLAGEMFPHQCIHSVYIHRDGHNLVIHNALNSVMVLHPP
mmetsp:Transcript_43566/g.78359  ORF Transcript_43566/g.78359 Transcript_43566/m.78359 type:complete len:222 (+) Transcript_43566:739-1404(+)